MSRTLESALDDFIWGKTCEKDYLESVTAMSSMETDAIARRVAVIDETLNKQLRKGVEENLSRLLQQTTALEALDRTQKGVHSEMNEVFGTCERFANNLNVLLAEYKQNSRELKQLFTTMKLLEDAMRCMDNLDSFDKRSELVKRSEFVQEVRGLVADRRDLLKVEWLKLLMPRLADAEKEVRTAASMDLRRALVSLNPSLVASACRALQNVNALEGELEATLSASAAELDAKMLELSSNSNDTRLLPACVNLVHAQLEQGILLGPSYMNKLAEKIARVIRGRVPVESPYVPRLVQQLSRVLQVRVEYANGALKDSLKPLKNAIMTGALARLHSFIDSTDFTVVQASVFVDLLNGMLEDECNVEWDQELKEEMTKTMRKSLELVAKKLEQHLKLDENSLLLGDRLTPTQLSNMRLLTMAHTLCCRWQSHSSALHAVLHEALDSLFALQRKCVSKILLRMHTDSLSDAPSPYMQELCSYLTRVVVHTSQLLPVLQHTHHLPNFVDFITESFILNIALLRPVTPELRQIISIDSSLLLSKLAELGEGRKYSDFYAIGMLLNTERSALSFSPDYALPAWLVALMLVSDSPTSLPSPHESVQWTVEEFVTWCEDHNELEKLAFLNGLMSSYAASTVSRDASQFVPHYPKIMEILTSASVNGA